jgi:hypothetical protein
MQKNLLYKAIPIQKRAKREPAKIVIRYHRTLLRPGSFTKPNSKIRIWKGGFSKAFDAGDDDYSPS